MVLREYTIIFPNLQPLQGFREQKKNASTIFCKMKSRLYKIDYRLAKEDRFYHNQLHQET